MHTATTWSTVEKILKLPSLRKLSPIIRDGLIYVGGSLRNSSLSSSIIHLIILPHRHPVTQWLFRYYHESEGHMGLNHVLACMCRKYWIVKGSTKWHPFFTLVFLAKLGQSNQQRRWWLICHRVELPQDFLLLSQEHIASGHSWFDKVGKPTNFKTRAIHLEVVHSLSTDSFLMALSRCIGRCGFPQKVYSDQWRNFVGAETELRSFTKKSVAKVSKRNCWLKIFNGASILRIVAIAEVFGNAKLDLYGAFLVQSRTSRY